MSLRTKFFREIVALGLPGPGEVGPAVTEAEITGLPEAAQRYLRFMGVVGRPRDTTLRLCFLGKFKVNPRAPWRPCEVWQYNTSPVVTRTFFMKINFGPLPVIGRDTYRDGHGRMLGRLMDWFTVIDGRGEEFDIGELVTYLNDAVLLAPSMLLTPLVTFEAVKGASGVDSDSFDLKLTDRGITVVARVFLDERGAPVNFETTDRFCEDPADPKKWMRARWSTPMQGFSETAGRMLPARGQAVWKLADGDLIYADFSVVSESVAYNLAPGE